MRAQVVIPIITSILILGLIGFSQDAEAASMTFTTDTTISLVGFTDIKAGETWTINPGVTLTIDPGVIIRNTGTITIELGGTINNSGAINSAGGTINNSGSINNSDSFSFVGLCTIDGCNFGGMTNSGTFTNSGTIAINQGITINNSGAIINCTGGSIINFGFGTITGNAIINDPCLPPPPPLTADLSITKIDNPDPVTAGNQLTYTLRVILDSFSPNDAENVVVLDTLPAGVTFISASGSGWTCNQAGGVVTCTRASIIAGPPPPDITITVTVNPDTVGTLTNTASVSSDTNDPDGSDNSVTEDTTSEPPSPDEHEQILTEVQNIEEKLDGDRPSLITQIINQLSSIANGIAQILGILQDPEIGLGEIKTEVRNIEANVTSPEFGLEEIKREIIEIENKLDNTKTERDNIVLTSVELEANERLIIIDNAGIGGTSDVEVTMRTSVGDDDDDTCTIQILKAGAWTTLDMTGDFPVTTPGEVNVPKHNDASNVEAVSLFGGTNGCELEEDDGEYVAVSTVGSS